MSRLKHLPLLLAAVLTLPALGAGLLMDDHWFLQVLGDPTQDPLKELFVFTRPEAVPLYWTMAPDLQLAFFRPLAAATHWLDYQLSHSVPLWHLQSWGWLLAAVGAATALYRRVDPGVTGLIAALLFAVEDAHAFPVAWLANRNALMSLAFGLWGLVLHQGGRRKLALLPLAACLLSAEAGLAAFAYVVAMEWRRPQRLLPHVALIAAWRLLYVSMDYGAVGSGAYVDPSSAAFAVALVERLPVHVLVQFLHFPGELWGLADAGPRQVVSALGWLYLLGLIALVLPLVRKDEVARMWALGTLGALVPVCAVLPMDRVEVWVGVGSFGLLSRLPSVFAGLSAMRKLKLGFLLLLHGPWAALLLPLRILGVPLLEDFIQRPVEDLDFASDEVVIFVTGNDLTSAYLTGLRHSAGQEGPLRVHQLGSASLGAEVLRYDESTLIVQTPPLMTKPMEQVTRSAPWTLGEEVRTADFRAQVVEVDPQGYATRIAFTFDQPLESYTLLAFDQGRRVRFEPQVGDFVTLQPGVPGME